MLTVKMLLTNKPQPVVWSIQPDQSVFEALEKMAEKNVGALPVVAADQLVGMFSERDYARKIILLGRESKNTRVDEIMTTTLHTIGPNDNIHDCMEMMSEKRIRHLPVLEGGNLVGMISIGDIVNAIIMDQKEHIQNLEQYIRS
jgi:CBS domain-containing protein